MNVVSPSRSSYCIVRSCSCVCCSQTHLDTACREGMIKKTRDRERQLAKLCSAFEEERHRQKLLDEAVRQHHQLTDAIGVIIRLRKVTPLTKRLRRTPTIQVPLVLV